MLLAWKAKLPQGAAAQPDNISPRTGGYFTLGVLQMDEPNDSAAVLVL